MTNDKEPASFVVTKSRSDRDFVLSSVLTYFVNRCYTNSDTIK